MVLNWVITHALCGSVWSSLELPYPDCAMQTSCSFSGFLCNLLSSIRSFAWDVWGECLRALPPLGSWTLRAPCLLTPLDHAMISLSGRLRNFMVRKQSHPWYLACYRVVCVSSCGSAQQQELEIPCFGIFIMKDGIPIATTEMCRRTPKPMSVVHCMRASDL